MVTVLGRSFPPSGAGAQALAAEESFAWGWSLTATAIRGDSVEGNRDRDPGAPRFEADFDAVCVGAPVTASAM